MSTHELHTSTWTTQVDGKPTSLRVRRCRLNVVAGQDAGQVQEFDDRTMRVGAGPACTLRLSDRRVSGSHFEIRIDDRGYRLRDLGSSNGTFIQGLQVVEAYISPGTVITIGGTRLRFEALPEAVDLPLSSADHFGGLLGEAPVMREVFHRLERIARSDSNVLVTGETGTGKELVAEAIHERSARVDKGFVVLDCGAVSPNLLESELFGHEKGAFTGAAQRSAGVFERANGGTVYLDEIGELPIDLQPKLIRVLEEKLVRPLGATHSIPIDVRVVAATHHDLWSRVNKGLFREDLFFRLSVLHVHLPPLRERKEDIPLLARHFIEQMPAESRHQLSRDAIELLKDHDWPGNVRELRNVLERALVLDKPPNELLQKLQFKPAGDGEPSSGKLEVPIDVNVQFKVAKQAMIDAFDRLYVEQLLTKFQWNISAAARAAGLDRMSIHKALQRLGIPLPPNRKKNPG